jgi:hypothetical protein
VADDFAGGAFQADTFLTSGAAPAQFAGIRPNGAAFTYAIAGLARAGATRAGYLPNISDDRVLLMSGGINKVRNVWKQTITVLDNLFQESDSCSFRTFDWVPDIESEIIVAAGTTGRRYFGGIVTQVDEESVKPSLDPVLRKLTTPKHPLYRVTCQDYMWRVNGKSVFGTWSGVAADIAIREIFQKFAPPGFSTAGVAPGMPAIADLTFDGEGKISDALDRITSQIGYQWFMDAYGVLWVFLRSDAMATPLFQAAPGTPYFHFDNLQIKRASNQLKTRVNVKASGGLTQAAYVVGAGDLTLDSAAMFPVPPPAGSSVFINGEVYDYSDVTGATLHINPPGLRRAVPLNTPVQLMVTYDNLDAQAALRARGHPDGIIEETMSDARRNYDGAMALAAANGGAFGFPRLSGTYTTVTGRARSGDRLLVHLPYRKVWTEAIVQTVALTLVNAPNYITRDVAFSDTKLITFQDILRARERQRKDR